MNRTPIDVKDALARIGDDREFLRELLAIYEEDLAARIIGLREAVVRGDLKAVSEIGHAIKGSSANLSLPGLTARAFAIESAGKNGDAAKAASNIAGLEKEFRRLREHLAANPL